MNPDPEPNEEIVNRIEAWLPGLEAPLDWIRPVNFELPTDETTTPARAVAAE